MNKQIEEIINGSAQDQPVEYEIDNDDSWPERVVKKIAKLPLSKFLALSSLYFVMGVVIVLLAFSYCQVAIMDSTLRTIENICLGMLLPSLAYFFKSMSENNKEMEMIAKYGSTKLKDAIHMDNPQP